MVLVERGVILDLEADVDREADLPESTGGARLVDVVHPRLWINYTPASSESPDDFYEEIGELAMSHPEHELMGLERTFVGDDSQARPALKVSTRGIKRVEISFDPILGRPQMNSVMMPKSEWLAGVGSSAPELDESRQTFVEEELKEEGFTRQVTVAIRTAMVVCLHPGLRNVFYFTFEDDEDDFVLEVESLHRCLRSVRFLN